MIDFIVSPGMTPFMIAYGVVIGLFAIELALLVSGAGSVVFGADGGDADFDMEFTPEATGDSGGADIAGDVDVGGRGAEPRPGFMAWLGLGEVPTGIWLVTLATCFGTGGYGLQLASWSLTGGTLPAWLASLATIIPAIMATRRLGRGLNRVIPRFESAAVSERSYGRRRGVVTVGVARSGSAARVRFTDGHGRTHYLMAEPLDPKDEIKEGAEVLIVRRREGTIGLVQISD